MFHVLNSQTEFFCFFFWVFYGSILGCSVSQQLIFSVWMKLCLQRFVAASFLLFNTCSLVFIPSAFLSASFDSKLNSHSYFLHTNLKSSTAYLQGFLQNVLCWQVSTCSAWCLQSWNQSQKSQALLSSRSNFIKPISLYIHPDFTHGLVGSVASIFCKTVQLFPVLPWAPLIRFELVVVNCFSELPWQ